MDKRIYGNEIAKQLRLEIKEEIESLERKPHLVVILVGENLASKTYIKGKEKACSEVGIKSSVIHFREDTSEKVLLNEIDKLNNDSKVDAILVQLPLPNQINEQHVIERIHVDKDVDGFNPMNIGRLSIGEKALIPCTPKGIMHMLSDLGLNDLSGKHVVVIGRSNIVGKPMAQVALSSNATVSIVHSKTKNIREITKLADILIVAVGQAKMIDESYIKEGTILIDVGINRVDGKICGDVDFDRVYEKVSRITPVPKGVGPMTIAMLLKNTLECFRRNNDEGL